MALEPNDKLEGLKFIAELHRSQFDERRRYEWRVVFTSLTFYVLCVGAVFARNVTIPGGWQPKLVIWLGFVGLALLITTFLASLHTANSKNKNFAENAEQAIAELVEGKEPTISGLFSYDTNREVTWSKICKSVPAIWAWRWQVVTLFSFAIASAILLTLE